MVDDTQTVWEGPSADGGAARLASCPECAGTVSRRALACPHCGCPHPADSAPPPTRVHSRTGAMIMAILTIPLFGLGIVVLLAMLNSRYRAGPCPYCGDRGSWREETVVRHVVCGNLVRRQDDYIHPANDQKAVWDGTLAKRRQTD